MYSFIKYDEKRLSDYAWIFMDIMYVPTNNEREVRLDSYPRALPIT